MIKFLFAITVSVLSASASAQTLYKCVVNGRSAFQDSPCATGSSTIISNRPAPPAGPAKPAAAASTKGGGKAKAPEGVEDDDPAVVDKTPYDPNKT